MSLSHFQTDALAILSPFATLFLLPVIYARVRAVGHPSRERLKSSFQVLGVMLLAIIAFFLICEILALFISGFTDLRRHFYLPGFFIVVVASWRFGMGRIRKPARVKQKAAVAPPVAQAVPQPVVEPVVQREAPEALRRLLSPRRAAVLVALSALVLLLAWLRPNLWPEDPRTLWDDARYGMTVAEVREEFPDVIDLSPDGTPIDGQPALRLDGVSLAGQQLKAVFVFRQGLLFQVGLSPSGPLPPSTITKMVQSLDQMFRKQYGEPARSEHDNTVWIAGQKQVRLVHIGARSGSPMQYMAVLFNRADTAHPER